MADKLGLDATGKNILDFAAEEEGKTLYQIVSQMVDHPCGAKILSTLTATTGRSYKIRSVGFPLRRREEDPDCIVWFNKEQGGEMGRASGVGMSDVEHVRWIDIGADVPAT